MDGQLPLVMLWYFKGWTISMICAKSRRKKTIKYVCVRYIQRPTKKTLLLTLLQPHFGNVPADACQNLGSYT